MSSAIEILMQPGCYDPSEEDLLPLRELIAEEIGKLTDLERYAFEAHYQKIPMAEQEAITGRRQSTLYRHRMSATRQLRKALQSNPLVQQLVTDIHPLSSCTICGRPIEARGWCQTHYSYWYKNSPAAPDNQCSTEGCERKRYSKGLCARHYQRQWAEEDRRKKQERHCPPLDREASPAAPRFGRGAGRPGGGEAQTPGCGFCD